MKAKFKSIILLTLLVFAVALILAPMNVAYAETVEATSVSVNNHSFTSASLYYKNDASDVTDDSNNYNAHYDPTTNTLTLNNYVGGSIAIGGAVQGDVKIVLVGNNTITTNDQMAISNINGGGIYITSGGLASLTINSTGTASNVYGIYTGSYGNGALEISGYANVTINVNSARDYAAVYGAYIDGTINVKDFAKLTVTTASANVYSGVNVGTGLYAKQAITFNTIGKIQINTSGIPSENGNIGIYSESNVNLTNAEELKVIVGAGSYAVPVYPASAVDSWTNYTSGSNSNNGVLTSTYTPKVVPTVSQAGVVSWENFGDVEYQVVVVNSQSQLVMNPNVGYALSFDVKSKLDELDRESGDYKIKINSKKNGINVSTNQVVYSYTSSNLQLDTPANLYWDGTVAKWDEVANATSYNVVLTDGNGGAIISKIISATSYDFAENIKNGAIFKVVAKADGYLDSAEAASDPSKSFVVKFFAGNGTGSKDKVILTPAGDDTEVEYTLPNPGGFYAPSGKIFSQWSVDFISGPNEEDPISFAKMDEKLTVNGDLYLTATWKDEAYTVTLYANDGKGTQQAVEDVFGAYALPDCPFDAPDGKEFDCWAIGSESGDQKKPGQGINVYDDTLVVALWKDKAFTVSPKNSTLTTGEAYVFDYKLSVDVVQINVQSYNGATWDSFSILTSTPPAANALASGSIGCPAVGWTGTKTLRLAAFDASSNQYFSDEFTVEWIESVFTSQPTSVTVPLGNPALITYSTSFTPASVRIEKNEGGVWEFLSGAEAEHAVISGYDFENTLELRIGVSDGSNYFCSNSFTVTWSESADAWAFDLEIADVTLKVGDASNIAWSVNFATTSHNIYIWNEEYEMWEHYDGDGEGSLILRGANESNDYDFQSVDPLSAKFKIVVSIDDVYELESNEFTINWVYYNATFKANGGEGNDVVVEELYGEYKLPECTFTAPAGKAFAGWAIGSLEGEVKQPGETVEISANTECYATWEDYTLVDTYAKLTEAITAGKRYIKLTANITHSAYSNIDFATSLLVFSGNGKTVLDLGGYTLKFLNECTLMTNEVSWFEVKEGHSLTIKNGTLILQNDNPSIDYTARGMIYVYDATLITENVNMQNKKSGSCVRAYSGAVTLNGGTLQNLNGWCVYAMYDVVLTLDGDVCLSLQNHANASASVGGGLYVLTEDVTLNILRAYIKDGISIPKKLKPTLETHVFYVNGARVNSELGIYATNVSATDAGATTYWLDQGNRIYLADAGDDNNYLANNYVILTSKAVKHNITVENGTATASGNEVSEGYYTQQITITADPIEGKIFDKWIYECEIGIVFDDSSSQTTTFEMPDVDIKLIPVYKNAPISYIEIYIGDPIIGDMLTREAMLNHEALYFSTNCHDNPDWKIQWDCETDFITNIEKGVFLPGKEYKALMQIKITDEAWNDWTIDPSLIVIVNGVSAEVVVYGDTVANIIITFQTPNPVFDVSFTEDSRAGLGGWLKVDTEKLDMNSEFANAESIEYIWVKDGEYIPGATGSSYKIKPEDANSNIYVLIKTEWNGANYYGVSDAKSVSHKVCVVYIDYDPIEGDCYIPYNSHKLFSVTDPELGSVVAVDWMDGSMVDMAEGDLLEEGAVYNLFIMYQLNEGFVWANDIAFCFNGGELVSSDYADPTNLIIAKLLEITAAEHTHTYEKEIYGMDDDGHWLRCDNEYCANRDEDCYQYVDHVSNDATCQTPGTCAVCGKDGIEGKHIYDGGEYVKTSEEYHEVKCLYCDETDGMENAHFGGTATCKSAKICEGCNSAYGELDPENHTGVEEWTKSENTHIKKYSCCDLVTVPESEHNIVSGECTVCGYGCTHTSATKQTGKAPECELDGWKDYYKCDKCGDFFTDESCESKIADIEQWKIGDGKLGKISHAWGSWTSNGDDSHTRICTNNNNHTETNDCSGGEATCTERAACTVCGEKYGNTAPHSYTTENGYKGDDGHANTCVCGAHDTPTAHTPDRQEPTEDDPKKCTVCGYIIEPATGHISHTPKDEWQSDSTHHWHGCTGCEGQQLDKAEHNPQEDDGDCTTPVLCVDCGRVVIEAKTHAFTNDCDKDCNNLGCENTRTTAHIPAEDDGDCTTDILCTVCGEIAVKGSDDHISGADDGDCTTEILCTVCGKVTVEAKDAHTPEADDGNCITAIKCTVCTTIITAAKGAHVDTDSNGKCDACGSTVEVPSPDPDPKKPKEGLSGGAIAGIVIGSVAVAGIGGFSIFWFVVKKNSFTELVNIFAGAFKKVKELFLKLVDKIKDKFSKK